MTDHQIDKQTLVAYFEGKIVDMALKQHVEDYIAADANPLFVQACMQTAWEQTIHNSETVSSQADWDTFSVLAGIRTHKKTSIRFTWAAAAALLVLIGVSTLYFTQQPSTHTATTLAWQTITATPTTQRVVQLADGSELVLYPGSSVRFNNEYNQTSREIFLDGRAYFNIAPVANKPFFVRSGNYTTEVLGTSFEIFEQRNRRALAVTLVSGKVRVLDKSQHPLKELQPDQQLVVNTDNEQFAVADVSAHNLMAWTSGHLNFEQVVLEDVCRDIATWYGIPINIHNKSLARKRITAGFDHVPLETVMTILSQTAGFTYKAVNGHIDIY
ncbi:FecR family protein [Chitinophaga skermanii]|uniref:FecR family protein n=1 Tax=Chitinophaga skermanii TaxID=331697 RepID=A0A327QUP3_9BACT|nr:FecR domain-containing protein [Chitinophaga skermanii]RAJ05447.1 FecR family protein [Chitinophaga skermanii]